jgi:hypothetical protein
LVAGSKPITTNPMAMVYINETLVSVMGEKMGQNSPNIYVLYMATATLL